MNEMSNSAAAVAFRTFTRPSRSGGVTHVIHLCADNCTPIDYEHPCSCKAGAEGRFCWALLEVLRDEAPKMSQEPTVLEIARTAGELLQLRAEKSVRTGRQS